MNQRILLLIVFYLYLIVTDNGAWQFFCDKEDSEDCEAPIAPKVVEQSTVTFVLMWFDLLGFLWNEQFLQALLVASIAGAVGMYYYTKPDDHNNRVLI